MRYHGPGFPCIFMRLALHMNHWSGNGFGQRAKTLIERGFQMRHMSRLQILSWVVLAVLLGPYASVPARAAEPIKVGGLFELTGFLNPVGKDAYQGAMIAIEEQGGTFMGRPLEFITEDSATDPSTTMDKARKLVEVDKVKIIVGPIFGPTTTAVAGYADRVQIPVISIAPLDDAVILHNKWSFSTPGTDTSMGYPMGVYAATKLGYKHVATLGSDFVAGHEFIGGFVLAFQAKRRQDHSTAVVAAGQYQHDALPYCSRQESRCALRLVARRRGVLRFQTVYRAQNEVAHNPTGRRGDSSLAPSLRRALERAPSALTLPFCTATWPIRRGTRNLWQPTGRSMVCLPALCREVDMPRSRLRWRASSEPVLIVRAKN